MKVIFEIEADLPTGSFEAVQLALQINDKWSKPVLFAFGRPQTVREGKHLKIDNKTCKVIAVGDGDGCPICGQGEPLLEDGWCQGCDNDSRLGG